MNKVMRIGTLPSFNGRRMSIFVHAQLENGKLSITGVEGPMGGGNAIGGCGQIVMSLREPEGLKDFEPAPGWTLASVERLLELWDRWHLNDMRAGSPAQEAWLRANPVSFKYPESHYEKASAALADAGLNPDADGYRYGHAWNREEIPADVVAEIEAFPDTDVQPAWI
jgi:hypothetical protein